MERILRISHEKYYVLPAKARRLPQRTNTGESQPLPTGGLFAEFPAAGRVFCYGAAALHGGFEEPFLLSDSEFPVYFYYSSHFPLTMPYPRQACRRDRVPTTTAFQQPEGAIRGLRQDLALRADLVLYHTCGEQIANAPSGRLARCVIGLRYPRL